MSALFRALFACVSILVGVAFAGLVAHAAWLLLVYGWEFV